MSKKLLKSGAIVSLMTLISRVLGLVRDVVVANIMGAGVSADVFFFANKIPNFLRRLFAEGAFAQAFVPVLSEYKAKESEAEVRELIARVSGTLGVLVTIVTLVGVIASPLVTLLFGAGWFIDWLNDGPDGPKFELASMLLRITFPYLWFITFTGLSGAILNSYGRFAVSSFTPVFLNVAIICSALFLVPHLAEPELGLACGVFIGGMIQFLFQIPFLLRLRMLPRPKWGWRHPGVTRIRTLMIPALFGVSVSQINLLLDTLIASFLMTGAISWLYYSDRLLEFPLGLFGIAIATVILPSLSKRHVKQQGDAFAQTMDWAIRMVCLLGIPAMVGMMVLAAPMLQVLFMRGAFSEMDVMRASYSLIAYSSGLIFFMLVKVLAPGYYARQDTRTPVRYGIIAMVSNMVFNIIFVLLFSYVGLAMATALSAMVNASLLYRGLHRQKIYQVSTVTLYFICRVIVSAVVMAVALLWLMPSPQAWLSMGWLQSAMALLVSIFGAFLSYVVILLGLGVRLNHLKITNGAVTAE